MGSPVVVFVTLLGLLAGWWYQSNQLGAHQFLFYWNNGCTQRWVFQMGYTGECVQHRSIVSALQQLDISYHEVEHGTFEGIAPTELRRNLSLPMLSYSGRRAVQRDIRAMCAAFSNSDRGILLVGSAHAVAVHFAALPCVRAHRVQVKLLDWFGSGQSHTPPDIELLTVTPSGDHNTFLGYALQSESLPAAIAMASSNMSTSGLVLGKEPVYFEAAIVQAFLKTAAGQVNTLHCIACPAVSPNIRVHAVMPQAQFHALLAEAWFLIGVGHPLGSPSVLEAIQAGAVAILRRFETPVVISGHAHSSQYDDLVQGRITAEQPALQNYTCSYASSEELTRCIEFATAYKRPPVTISSFSYDSFVQRMRRIFSFNITRAHT